MGLLAATFLIGRIMPIDPVVAAAGADLTTAQYARVAAELGLDQPLLVQFGRFVLRLVQFDFGQSFLSGNPVAVDIARVFPATVELATLGILIGATIGVPAGIVAAVMRGTWVDAVLRCITLIGYSMPVFWKGLMLMLVFYVMLGWAEGPGRQGIAFEGQVPTVTGLLLVDCLLQGDWDALRDAWGHVVYMITASVKGASTTRMVLRHALPNCGVQLITTFALTYGLLLEGAVLTETVFAWPGLGQYMTKAMFNADMNAVIGGTFVIGMVFVVLNQLSDLAYRRLDPRSQ
ncbi:MAG: ABC transporter permease [Betaproteobacteria bacterium]|nr:ABC transporter permease [Betaproteobacteria bacterium]